MKLTAKPLSQKQIAARIRDAGKRAAAEAEERRRTNLPVSRPKEIGGPQGPEPTRFGDWERNGIASDF